ncbi:hypothetical protein QBC34DRAFT_132941 [Podospora aff. communis PSN243]|uniref:Uncharacterized protein n=1 Tax=Podospora aff. communis PSN243 TaxID=3040156 RepID=A0AAV9GII2_9PEZI|nr:hypothetical protein QBC34DRAFT_132941 [Podospora aff. communis PSN243]
MKLFTVLAALAAVAMAAPTPDTNVEARTPEPADTIEARACPGSSLCLGGQCRSFQCIGGGPEACGYYPIGVPC